MAASFDITVRDSCRELHGDAEALELALKQTEAFASKVLEGWDKGKGVEVRIEVHVIRP